MKLTFRYLMLFLLLLTVQPSLSQEKFTDWFNNNTLRWDFMLAGNNKEAHVFPVQVWMEPGWAGSKLNLIDSLNYGTYRFQVFDETSGTLIFSRGFATLFQEWQTTAEAKVTERAYYQALFFPFPKHKVKIKIENRDWGGDFKPLFEVSVDPSDYFIHRESPQKNDIIPIMKNGEPENHVDIVFLSEGYGKGEKEKFTADVNRMKDNLFAVSPFSENKEKFNITAVWTPSDESGTDIPGERIYKNTRFNSTFYTFDISRYLTTSDMKSIYDAVAAVPHDFVIVLVNTTRYGGGGFYNFLTVCSADHELTPKVLVHEFGHAFAGLADEYYNSEVAYEDFYNLKVEPWEPNITTLVNFASKWKSMITDSIPVPTPRIPRYAAVTGVFEGGGYMTRGIYSPMQDCRMKSNVTEDFCPVCKAAIQRVIDWYSN